ncbi:MAG TPA: GPR1/FUN34/YaaH family transporter [Streptosporangiaceae bacterium]|jgi:succinate-acetate transporter protein
MAAIDANPNEAAVQAEATPEVTGLLAGDPMALGLPSFIVGSVALGLVLIGMVPAAAVGASLPIILAATAAGLFIATIWAAAVGQSAVACVFGVFGGFWLSYAVLVLGLTHNWFGIAATDVASTEELFLTAWLIVIVLLTVATLRLPLAFTVILGLVDVALLLVLLGTANASTGLLKTGGVVALVFAAVGAYVFAGTAAIATGGSALPLGKPVLR